MRNLNACDEDFKVLDAIYHTDEVETLFQSVSANISVVTENQSLLFDNDVPKSAIEVEQSAENLEETISIESMYGKDANKSNKIIPENLAVTSRQFFEEMSK